MGRHAVRQEGAGVPRYLPTRGSGRRDYLTQTMMVEADHLTRTTALEVRLFQEPLTRGKNKPLTADWLRWLALREVDSAYW